MREIKFRAWDNENECFSYSDKEDDYYSWGFEYGVLGCWVAVLKNFEDGDTGYTSERIEAPEQYTGLKDKNGREIYEGDCLRVTSQYETEEPIDSQPNAVTFRDGSFHCGFFDMILNNAVCTGIESSNWACEVIGNIHENPELLEAR